MKMHIPTPTIEASGDFAEKLFGIGDAGIIFDILRSKLYSNPISAVCREIASNARDAMREAKKANEPIHIQLPNSLDPNFKVKDFGIGISPDRVESIFIKYAASTKRGDNVQTGFFGIGSKSPFSVSDTFTVITNYDGTQYHYSCVIDETRVGKLITLSEKPTKEPNGTTIVVPAKPADFRSFSEYVEISTRNWDPRPVITGDNKFVWHDITKVLEGTNWAVASTSRYSYDKHIKLIIDGIEYPLDIDTLRTYADCSLVDATQGTLYLYFNNGEVSLSAGREQIFLDKPTQEKVKLRLKEITAELKKSVLDKIDALPSLWEANVFYKTGILSSFYDHKFLGDLTWKGLALSRYDLNGGCKVFNFTKGAKWGDDEKISRRDGRYIRFEKGIDFYVNDLPIQEPTANHVKKAFEANKDLKTIQVICPTETITVEKLNKDINLDKLNPKLLSTITTVSPKKSTTVAKARLTTFKFNSSWCQTRYDAMVEDKAKIKVLATLHKDLDWNKRVVGRTATIDKGKKVIDNWRFPELAKSFPLVSFYGIDENTDPKRIEEDFSDLVPLDNFIQDEIIDDNSANYPGLKYAHGCRIDYGIAEDLKNYRKLITDPESPFIKRLEAHNAVEEMTKQSKGKLELYEMLHKPVDNKEVVKYVKEHPEHDLNIFNKDYQERYPLLSNLGYSPVLKHIAHYVNLVDQENKTKKEEAA